MAATQIHPNHKAGGNLYKGRCTRCRWVYTAGERYCSWCAHSVRWPVENSKATGKGKGAARQEVRRSNPPHPHFTNGAASADAGQDNNAKPDANLHKGSPPGKTTREQETRSPETLEKVYLILKDSIGEADPLTIEAKERWDRAQDEAKRRTATSLEKQVHIAKERIGRMQKKVEKAQLNTQAKIDEVGKCQEALEEAKKQVNTAIDGVKEAEQNVKEAQDHYTALVTKLRQQTAPQLLAQDLLYLIGVDKDGDIPPEAQQHMLAAQQMMQQVMAAVAAAKQPETPQADCTTATEADTPSKEAPGAPQEAGTPGPTKREAENPDQEEPETPRPPVKNPRKSSSQKAEGEAGPPPPPGTPCSSKQCS